MDKNFEIWQKYGINWHPIFRTGQGESQSRYMHGWFFGKNKWLARLILHTISVLSPHNNYIISTFPADTYIMLSTVYRFWHCWLRYQFLFNHFRFCFTGQPTKEFILHTHMISMCILIYHPSLFPFPSLFFFFNLSLRKKGD